MRNVASFLLFLISLSGSALAAAGWFGASFSADVVQTSPQGGEVHGRMYVGDGRVRTEVLYDGVRRVEIFAPEQQTAYMLLPEQEVYSSRPVPQMPEVTGSGDNPCAARAQLTCELQGTESLNGRDAKRWQVSAGEAGGGIIWTDVEHQFPVKQVIDGKLVSELRFLTREQVGGREAEKWESLATLPDGKVVRGFQWYDPELRIAIRQEAPGGAVRELRNIDVGAQPDYLFTVPEDYRQVEPQ